MDDIREGLQGAGLLKSILLRTGMQSVPDILSTETLLLRDRFEVSPV